ncbi:MAG TPA: methyltransferase domain-containing protein [Burkholderiales bacterium]|nr:methyltransferase domain-containing protein [Burkholderiales bacterium]
MRAIPRTAALLLGAALALGVAHAQTGASVPYVPTPKDVVEKMLKLARVGAGDYVIDLGCGDGRILVAAAKQFGARGFGVDINPERIAESDANARKAGVTDRVAFHQQDLFKTDFSDATVLTMYLLPAVNRALRPKILSDLKPGTRVVSHDFDLGAWEPDHKETMYSPDKYGVGGSSTVYLWIVPAKAAGNWSWQLSYGGATHRYQFAAKQDFQMLSGDVTVDGASAKIHDGKLNGAEISFKVTAQVGGAPVVHEFNGRINGDAVTGEVALSGARLQSRLEWSAARTASAQAQAK